MEPQRLASAVSSHLSEIRQKISATNVGDARAFLQKPEVQDFMKKAKKVILEADVNRGLTPDMLMNDAETLEALKRIAPAGVVNNPGELQNFGNLLVGHGVTEDYANLMRSLDVTGDTSFRDMNNPRVTAVLIYDKPQAAEKFRDASYETPGKFSSWKNDGQTPLTAAPYLPPPPPPAAAEEVIPRAPARPNAPPPHLEERKGFFQRLFGG
jgi:hypothetical protein